MSFGFLPSSLHFTSLFLFLMCVIADISIVKSEFEQENRFNSIFPIVFTSRFVETKKRGRHRFIYICFFLSFVDFFFRSTLFPFDIISGAIYMFRVLLRTFELQSNHACSIKHTSSISTTTLSSFRLSGAISPAVCHSFLTKIDSIQYQHRMHIVID